MRIIITGGTGLLGKALIEENPDCHEILATYVGDYLMPGSAQATYINLDVRDKDGYFNLFQEYRPEVIIHTASIGSPDYAEKNKEKTWQVNVEGTKNICELCKHFDAKFIHVSSNGIYDGNHAPYKEDDKAVPINYYGMTKLESENVVRKSQIIHAIIRPILMYGWPYAFERGNIITFVLSRLEKGEAVNVYDDVFCNPLYVEKCAEAIWKNINEDKYDVYNIAGRDTLSVHDLAKCAAEAFGHDTGLIRPVRQGFFNELVKRPRDTSYDTTKMRRVLGLEPLGVHAGLIKMKEARQRL